jgi:ABC-type Na+ efflux pump permease subunit
MSAPVVVAPVRSSRHPINVSRMLTVTRTELRQLRESKDFWVPMVILGAFFFLVVPTILLLVITSIGNVSSIQQVSEALKLLPATAREAVPQNVDASSQVSYVLAVYLFAPIAVVVPLTISTAVGASSIVGERERGTGEFLAHSPADVKEIYLGKLIASLVPGYLTTVIGFGCYSLMVNLLVGPKVGGWFFPTASWWLLILWVLPPFMAIALSLVLRLSARVRSTAAAQQAAGLVTFPLILIAYTQSTGSLVGSGAPAIALGIGFVAWVIAFVLLSTGFRSLTRGRLLGVADER